MPKKRKLVNGSRYKEVVDKRKRNKSCLNIKKNLKV